MEPPRASWSVAMFVKAEHPGRQDPVPGEDSDSAITGGGRNRVFRYARPLSAAVFLLLVVASVSGSLLMRSVVRDTENRLVHERHVAVSVVLGSSIADMGRHTQALSSVLKSQNEDLAALFTAEYTTQKSDGVVEAAAAELKDGTFRMKFHAGSMPSPLLGQPVPPALTALLHRAASSSGPVAGLIAAGPGRILIVAQYAQPFVIWQETMLGGTTQISGADNPFRDLRGALFLGRVPDEAHLLLTTEPNLPVPGHTQTSTVPLGAMPDADVFTLVTSSIHPLVGQWTNHMPLILLASGLVIAIAVGSALNVLSRRRDYARAQVTSATVELAETNRELHRAERFLDRLIAAGPVVVLRVNAEDWRATYVSANLESRLGFTHDEALQPGFLRDHIDQRDHEAMREHVCALSGASSPSSLLEVRLAMPDGDVHWVSAMLVAEPDLPGEFLAYVQDVDVQRRAEQAQQAAVEAAQAANRSKSEFVSRMSHELRTPLNAVLGYSQLLQMDELTPTHAEAVAHILSGGRHLLGLINEILDISAIESGRLELNPETIDVELLVTAVVAMVRPQADAASISVVSKVQSGWVATADAQRTRQVLLNLLTNAVKYNRPAGKVSITCDTAPDGQIQLSVSDTGIGIAEERIELAFAPFERLDAQQTEVEGTGIGLWLSRRLADAMGGSLTCTSAVGAGTTFTLSLPSAQRPDAAPDQMAGNRVPNDDRSIVLHVDDHAPNRDLVDMIFARRSDINLVNASLGAEGLRKAVELRPAVVLLDLHLPDIDGREVLRRLRDTPETSDIPVVVLSADATPEQIERLVTDGAAVYLTKPIDVDELLSVVHELVAGS